MSSCNNCFIGGIQVEGICLGGSDIDNENNVVFNKILNVQSDNISYDSTTGEFTITKPGNYYVDWWIAVVSNGGTSATSVNFTIKVNGISYSTASSPALTGQLSGEALVTVTNTPAIITLVNTTGSTVSIPATLPVQANMVIAEVVR